MAVLKVFDGTSQVEIGGHAQQHAIDGGDHTGTLDHSEINDDEATKHRIINDAGAGATELWSASKIGTELGTKAIGPGASTDHAIARWDGVGGYLLQDSVTTVADDGAITSPGRTQIFGTGAGTQNITMRSSNDGTLAWSGVLQQWTFADHVNIAANKDLRFGAGTEEIVGDGAGTLTIAANTAVAITQATSITTSLTTPLVIGGTAAGSSLTLQSTSHGSPANDYIDVKTMGSRVMRIQGDATAGSHKLVLGMAIPVDAKDDEVVVTTDGSYCQLGLYTHSATPAHRSTFRLACSRGTAAVPATLVNGDSLGSLSFTGYSDDYYDRAEIRAVLDGVPSGVSLPSALSLRTGTTAATERLRIASDGHILVVGSRYMQFRDANQYVYSRAVHALTLGAQGSDEVEITQDSMTFMTGGNQPSLRWPSIGTLELRYLGTTRFTISAVGIGFYATSPVVKQTITGARDVPEEALAMLLTKLALTGLLTDSTTAS